MDKDINKWIALAEKQAVPVLKHTIRELRQLCLQEDIPIKEITHVVERDPGLVVHILHNSNNRPHGRLSTEITHVNQAFRLMGTNQLTRLPDALPAVGDTLDEKAKNRLLETFDRAYHAARFATDWAALRRDMTPDEVFAATQLHYLGEMVLAMHEPDLLDEISRLRVEENIAAEEAQYLVLGFTLNELTKQIAIKWKLPALVCEALSAENARFPRAYGIMLAVQLAGYISDEGWFSKKTYGIQKRVAEWMDLALDFIIARTHTIAAEVAREIPQYDTPAAARLLPLIFKATEAPVEHITTEQPASKMAEVCLIPQIPVLRSAIQELTHFSPKNIGRDDVLKLIVSAMHDGIGLNRVVFCLYNDDERMLQGHIFKGAENDPAFNRFKIKVDDKNLFSHFITKPQAVLINEASRTKFWPLVPVEFQKLINTNSFIAMSVFVKNKPYGIFYADRHTASCQLDERSYHFFKTFCTHATKIIEQLS